MRALVLFLFLLSVLRTFSQSQIATPRIFNYTAGQYQGGVQNWDIAQDKNGVLYFGNKEGLLTFNGKYWSKYPLPNFTVVRSVKVDPKNRIFVGGQDEIGYFFPDEHGILKYHSLLGLLPASERKMADIWDIVLLDNMVFFRSRSCIIQYQDGVARVYKPETSWEFMGVAKRRIYAQLRGKGLVSLHNGVWRPAVDQQVLKDGAITFIQPYRGDTLLVGTLKSGLFLLSDKRLVAKKTDIDDVLVNDRLFCGARISNDQFALGTTSSGVFIVNTRGRVQEHYSTEDGLQTENIRRIFLDHNGSMWLSLDDGIDMVAINSPIKYIHPVKHKQVTYSMRIFDNKLYVASSNGVSFVPLDTQFKDLSFSKGRFKALADLKGQTWNLDELNDQLLSGHEDGLFELKSDKINLIDPSTGTWMLQPVGDIHPVQSVIAGTYNGLEVVNYVNGQFKKGWTIPGINESLRFIVYDNATNTVWGSHPYHGIYKIRLSPDLKHVLNSTLYTQKDGLPSTLYNYIYKVHNRMVVATKAGIYEFDKVRNRFIYSPYFKSCFGKIPVLYLKEDNENNVWFITNIKEVGVMEMKPERKGHVTYFPELKGKIVGGFESIYPYNSSNIFIGATKGILHLNYDKFKANKTPLKVILGQVKLAGDTDSIIFGGYFMHNGSVVASQQEDHVFTLKHNQNYLHFEYSSTLYNEQNNIEYSYRLEGLDKNWSVWTGKSEKDYTSLPAGNYIFNVKARNNSGQESNVVVYRFVIAPVWYKSVWSYICYIALILFIVFRLLKWQQKKHKKEQERLNYLNQLELDKNEKEIIRLKNEKLKADIEFKNRELANMVMHLVQRGKVIEKIKGELAAVAKTNEAVSGAGNFRRLIRLIAEVEKGERDREQFNIYFNNVHSDFFEVLQNQYPDITSNELKLCAFIKMNLTTKEIAQLMNITPKAVEVARYRLRKKLTLQTDTNLYNFLMHIHNDSKPNGIVS